MTLDLFPGVVYSIYFSLFDSRLPNLQAKYPFLFSPLFLYSIISLHFSLSLPSFLPNLISLSRTWRRQSHSKNYLSATRQRIFFCLFCESTLQTVDYYFYFFLFIFFNIFKKIFLQSARNCVAGMEVITSFAESLLPPPRKKNMHIFLFCVHF